jgi:hypothetical protein
VRQGRTSGLSRYRFHNRDHRASPSGPLRAGVATIFFAGASVYLTTFAFTRWHMFHTLATPRVVSPGICLGLTAVAPDLPAVASVATLAAVLIILNVVEHRVSPRILYGTA